MIICLIFGSSDTYCSDDFLVIFWDSIEYSGSKESKEVSALKGSVCRSDPLNSNSTDRNSNLDSG